MAAPEGPFRALRVHESGARVEYTTLDALNAGSVVVRVSHASLNHKDALAITGRAPIARRFPLVGGLDLAGTVVRSEDPRFVAGEAVLATGCGLTEHRDGGYAEYARVDGDALVPLPPGLSARAAMALGTAGFTVALALRRLEANGQRPDSGPIAVTGATGGVGMLAIDILAGLGYEVHAITGTPRHADLLRELGAREVLPRAVLETDGPLARPRFAGALDNAGGAALAGLLTCVAPQGNVVAIGLAAGAALHTTVLPFILRGISLLGVTASNAPREIRAPLWQQLASDWRPRHLDRIAQREIGLDDLPEAAAALLDGRLPGRTVVRLAE